MIISFVGIDVDGAATEPGSLFPDADADAGAIAVR
jgi:hypothetical protein